MLELTVLGSAASIPTKDRGLSSYAIYSEGQILLFDFGEGTQRQLLNFNLSYGKINAIFISHLHLDHFLGLFGFLQTLALSNIKKKISLFAPIGLAKFLSLFKIKDTVNFYPLQKTKNPIFSTKNLDVFSKKVNTHNVESYIFLVKEKDKICFYEKKAKSLGINGPLFSEIEKKGKIKINKKFIYLKDISYLKKGKSILYCGDGSPPINLEKTFLNPDLLIHECTFDNSLESLAKERFHSTPKQAASFARKIKAKKLLLTHVSARYSKDPSVLLSQAKKIFKNSLLAYDGLKLII
ncbi:MAG: ribonuclease Z [Candidatus Omnitrophica bacterium]|nr:ribonuclease Z [Candidatus Omnitrophota bacterium]